MEALRLIATDNIEFLGFLKGSELQNKISNASFVITPSEWYENNPMSVIEALTLGKTCNWGKYWWNTRNSN